MTQDNNLLAQIQTVLLQTAQQQQQTAVRLDQVAQQQQTNTAAIAQLTEEVDSLRDIVMHAIANAETDRELIREMQSQVRGIQTENQRILEYLFGQQQS